MNIKRLIPNLFTMLNLFCGCLAVVFASIRGFEMAFYLVCLGIFFDFFDGFFARKFGVAGPLGVQLDSLADMVTSGVVPGLVMFEFFGRNASLSNDLKVISIFGFVITLGACYRLAKFNIDTRQSDSFIGLPTPANALFFTSLPIVFVHYRDNLISSLLVNIWVFLLLCILSAYIMNAEIPLFSLKIKDFSFAKYKLQIFFLAVSVLMLIFLQVPAVPLIIILYVLLSVFNNIVTKKASN